MKFMGVEFELMKQFLIFGGFELRIIEKNKIVGIEPELMKTDINFVGFELKIFEINKKVL